MINLSELNPEQKDAVTSNHPRILCMAGAGSGKTKTVISRVGYLNQEKRVSCNNILCLTFTRLAGKELKERAMKLLGKRETSKLFANTIHAFCVSVLKHYGDKLGYDLDFSIYDQEDTLDILNTIITEFNYKLRVNDVLSALSIDVQKPADNDACAIINEYRYRLKQNNAFDFDGLMRSTIELFNKHPDILEYYHNRYCHIFVDEAQDLDATQWQLIDMLNPENLFVVGDFRQSIYAFRGAKPEIMMNLADNSEWQIINLVRNYRSTKQIVNMANNLIAHNYPKAERLIAFPDGEIPQITPTDDETEEAKQIAFKIGGLVEGDNYKDFAILTRTNRQLKNIKAVLDAFDVPAMIVSNNEDVLNVRDIRMLLSYLEFSTNTQDDFLFNRIINWPERRLTDKELMELKLLATNNECPLYDVMPENSLTQIINELQQINNNGATVDVVFERLLDMLYVGQMYIKQGRMNKITDLKNAFEKIAAWTRQQEELGDSALVTDFMAWLHLRDIQESLAQPQNKVKLMTVHASKGLEFDTVFIAGMNQGLFPIKKGDIEEERRLFYVAITRAKRNLFISRAKEVPAYNGYGVIATEPSKFLNEI